MFKRDILVGLANNKNVLRQFVSAMKSDEIHRRIKDYWTIYEHIDHLVVTQKLLLGRIQQFIVEEQPAMKPYVPEDEPVVGDAAKAAARLVLEFCELRDMQLALIKKAKRNVWQRAGSHPEYHRYGFEILLRHILLHDSVHMARMEDLWIMREELIHELK